MSKCFNITGSCIPEQHYMVDIHDRLEKIRDKKYNYYVYDILKKAWIEIEICLDGDVLHYS